jgi:hypothetical protein
MKFELQHVHYMPTELKPGVLYVSEEFGIAIHLCACGCESKIKTPLGPTEWSVKETKSGPTLAALRGKLAGTMPIPLLDHSWRNHMG